MTVSTQQHRVALFPVSWPRGWRLMTALITLAAGAAVITGAFLPWVEAFAGLIPIPGVRGDNGKLLAVAGAVIVAAGLTQLVTGGPGLAVTTAASLAAFATLLLPASPQPTVRRERDAGGAGAGNTGAATP